MIKESVAHTGHETTVRMKGTCAGCGTTTKTLIAPRKGVGHSYTGPMHCMGCTPRFGGVMLAAGLERLV